MTRLFPLLFVLAVASADAGPADGGPAAGPGMPTLSVRNLWKVFGPAEHKVIGTADAEL